MPHGADLLRCLERVRSAQNTEESTSCTLSIKIEPDTRGLDPGIHEAEGGREAVLFIEDCIVRRDHRAPDRSSFRDMRHTNDRSVDAGHVELPSQSGNSLFAWRGRASPSSSPAEPRCTAPARLHARSGCVIIASN